MGIMRKGTVFLKLPGQNALHSAYSKGQEIPYYDVFFMGCFISQAMMSRKKSAE